MLIFIIFTQGGQTPVKTANLNCLARNGKTTSL